jgi:hypothetical protein
MFVQVVRTQVADADAVMARLDHWLEHLAPSALGWLGTTAGVTRENHLVSFVRFASEDDARRSSDRVEQGQWWAESMLLFTGDVSFDNYDGVALFGDGGSDAAAMVEVVRGRVRVGRSGADLANRLAQPAMDRGRDAGLIGGLVGALDDGSFTQAAYFCRSALDRPPPRPEPGALAQGREPASDVRQLRLTRLWFGSPEHAGRPAAGTRSAADREDEEHQGR